MGMSALEVLIVPVVWATFAGMVAGATALVLMKVVKAFAGLLCCRPQSPVAPLAARSPQPLAAKSSARGTPGRFERRLRAMVRN
jgi:hypothetical protein